MAGIHQRGSGWRLWPVFVTGSLPRGSFWGLPLQIPFDFLFHPCLEKPGYLRAYSGSVECPQMGKLCFMQKSVGFGPGGMHDHPKPPTFRKITACLKEVLLGGWGNCWTLVICSEDPAKCRWRVLDQRRYHCSISSTFFYWRAGSSSRKEGACELRWLRNPGKDDV